MNTYNTIINNVLNLNNNIFHKNYKSDNIDLSFKLLFNFIANKEITIKEKFIFLKESLEHFLIKNKENEFIYYFCKIQKTYNTLNRFAYNYKYKKAQIVVNTDMCLNEINLNNKDVICLFHNNSKYLFIINDLIKIINSALTHSYMFFSEPKCIKNPYDNLPLNKANLYNIYFFIKFKTIHRPELLFKFFQSNFKLNLFKFKNELVLRDYIIENFVYKSPSDTLVTEIKNMIKFFNRECMLDRLNNRIIIDKEFPNDKLIKIMRPYLLLYCIYQYGYLQHMRTNSLFILKKKLLEFNNFNPQFGRKRYKILTKVTTDFKKKICGKLLEFDDKHVEFSKKLSNEDFLTDHLTYDENYYINMDNSNTFIFVVDEEEYSNNNEDEDDSDTILEPNENTIFRADAEDELDEEENDNDELDSVS
jgi:cell fate (sporulation/competence/biofilm development) regulator YlbF (YheA/YmcA/DUF963 family)